jgi:hypothetical protein
MTHQGHKQTDDKIHLVLGHACFLPIRTKIKDFPNTLISVSFYAKLWNTTIIQKLNAK